MPVDNTRVISPRRTQKKLTEEELKEIDRKRLLGELSCAECRRLKLRCDKKLPCGSCYRRGCESICPLGILAAGQGTRFILADTEQLHDKIYEMSTRIRQLEDALAILQSTVSDQRHPLLSDELLKIKFGSEAINSREHPTVEKENDNAMNKSIDALGTLTLGSSGEMQYFGRSAGSETLMMRAGEEADGSSDDDNDGDNSHEDIFLEVEKMANLFPFTTKSRPNMHGLQFVETFLPPFERASQLCDSYIKHASYFFRPIKPDDLRDDLLPTIYKMRPLENNPNVEYSPHALATLYFIFALGCLLDLTRPPYNTEAERYYDLGRAALSLRPVYDAPNMDSVQAVGLMGTYHSLAGKRYSRDSAWCAMSIAAKLAQSIGLHRDSARWNMDTKTVDKRRNLFWEVFSADVSHSLALGRPPATHLSYVDSEFPIDDDASLSSDAETQSGFWRMKHTFARDIYNSVAEATLTAKSPSYNTILDLDRKVREMSFPAAFNPYVSKDVGEEIFHSSSLSLRDFYASQHRTVTMIYLHRSFFAQAMLDHPTNPLLSPFAPSFLTAYRSASVIIKASAHLFERCAEMAMRLWFLMYHTFSAAVIVGTVVTRSPNSNIASIAMRDFNVALSLFETTAAQSQRAKIALAVLLKLQVKANNAYDQQYSGTATEGSIAPTPGVDEIEDELAIFGGQMKVLDRKGKQAHQKSSSISGTSSASPSSPTSSPSSSVSPLMNPTMLNLGSMGLEMPDVHPSLITYLNQDAVRKAVQAGQNVEMGGSGQSSSILTQGAQAPSSTGSQYPRLPSNNQSNLGSLGSTSSGTAIGGSTTIGGFVFPPLRSQSQYSTSATPQSASNDWSNYNTFRDDSMEDSGRSSTSTQIGRRNQSFSSMSHSFGTMPRMYSGPNNPANLHQQTSNTFYSRPASDYGSTSYLYSGGPVASSSESFANFDSASTRLPQNSNWNEGDGNPMDTAGVVEMGLSSESGMDARWMSLMRDYGIMDSREG